jgi:hypothetical protein
MHLQLPSCRVGKDTPSAVRRISGLISLPAVDPEKAAKSRYQRWMESAKPSPCGVSGQAVLSIDRTTKGTNMHIRPSILAAMAISLLFPLSASAADVPAPSPAKTSDKPRQLALSVKPWTGDFEQMIKRRMIRVLVPYSRGGQPDDHR